MKPWIYGICPFFVGFFLIRFIPMQMYDRLLLSVGIIFIMPAHLILNLVFMSLEIKENRVRRFCALPVSVNLIGLARLITPFIIFLPFWLLAIFDFTTTPPDFLYEDEFGALYPMDEASIRELIWGTIAFWGIWLMIIYAFRLGTELYGKILLFFMTIIFLALSIVSVYYPLQKFANIILDLIVLPFQPPWGLFSFALVPILFCLVIHLSFLRRRSYLVT